MFDRFDDPCFGHALFNPPPHFCSYLGHETMGGGQRFTAEFPAGSDSSARVFPMGGKHTSLPPPL